MLLACLFPALQLPQIFNTLARGNHVPQSSAVAANRATFFEQRREGFDTPSALSVLKSKRPSDYLATTLRMLVDEVGMASFIQVS